MAGSGTSEVQEMAKSVDADGIRFVFARSHPVGRFVSGDPWVVGPVQIVRITPEGAMGRNGFEVNPSTLRHQPYDDRVKDYDPLLQPEIPFTSKPRDRIVKTVSVPEGKCRPCLAKAAILTVLASPLPDGGEEHFRPGYFGPWHEPVEASLKLDILPRLSGPISRPSLENIENNFRRIRLDHKLGYTARYLHPAEHMPDYGANIAKQSAEAVLRLMLDDPPEDKRAAAVALVQNAIDLFSIVGGGGKWSAAGGHSNGRKLPMVLAAELLDSESMRQTLRSAPYNTFGEEGSIYFSPVSDDGRGMVLFGIECTPQLYWIRKTEGRGPKDCRDPYGYIDGTGYQYCCTSMVWKGIALALRLMPSLQSNWTYSEEFLAYVDRYVSHGVWRAPDPCSSVRPDDLRHCVPGEGRIEETHGTNADQGHYQSSFVNELWTWYRAAERGS